MIASDLRAEDDEDGNHGKNGRQQFASREPSSPVVISVFPVARRRFDRHWIAA